MLDWLNSNDTTTVVNTAFTVVLLLIFLFLLILHLLSKRDDEGALGASIDLIGEEEESDYDYGSWLNLTPEEPILDTDGTKDIPLDWSYTPIRCDASDWVKELDLTLGSAPQRSVQPVHSDEPTQSTTLVLHDRKALSMREPNRLVRRETSTYM